MPRRCRQCREYNIPKSAPKEDSFCTYECKVAYAMAAVNKSRQQRAKLEKQKHSRQKKEFRANDLPHQIELTQGVFNEMIRLLDRGTRCRTCDEPLMEGMYDAGHVRTVASCPQLRFDARACFGQCRSCNGSGTIRKRTRKPSELVSDKYRAWILATLGSAHHDWLYGHHDLKKYTCADLIEMRAVFAAERTRLKKGLGPSRDWRKLPEQQTQEKAA